MATAHLSGALQAQSARPSLPHGCLGRRAAQRGARAAPVRPQAAIRSLRGDKPLARARGDAQRPVHTPEVLAPEPSSPAEQQPTRWQKLLESLARGSAACALAAVLLVASVSPALAARSGGRLGGSGFSAARSFGGTGSSGLASGLSGGMSHSLGSGAYSSGLAGSLSRAPGLHSASRPLVNRGTALGWGLSPFGPWGGGYGYGYGYPGTTVVTTGGGGGGLGTILVFALLAVVAWSIFNSFQGRGDEVYDEGYGDAYAVSERVSVVKLQVALVGQARALQRRLERIADKADTDSPQGLHYILQETVLELMRNPEYAVYGEGSVQQGGSLDRGEALFNEASLRERGKVKEETLVNVGGQRRGGRMSRAGGSGIQELILVTIIAAVRGKVSVPRVTTREELTTALAKLGGVGQDQTLAVEVLWSPQDEEDSYSRDELLMDHPTLHTL